MTRILLLAIVGLACSPSPGPRPPTPVRQAPPPAAATPADATAPTASSQRVLVVTTGTMLEAALLVHDGIEVTSLSPADYERDRSVATKADVIIFDGYTPTELPGPPVDLMMFGVRGPIETRGEVKNPRITDIDRTHPLMADLDMSNVFIASSLVFVPDAKRGETALARSVRDAIIAVRVEGSRKVLAFGFALHERATDFPLRAAFPLLLARSLEWFAADHE